MKLNLDVDFKFVRTELLSHSIALPSNFQYDRTIHKISGQTDYTIDVDTEENLLKCTIFLKMSLKDIAGDRDEIEVFSMKTISIYSIEDMSSITYKTGEDIDMYDEALHFFNNISINHLRGMQSVLTNGTGIERFFAQDFSFPERNQKKLNRTVGA